MFSISPLPRQSLLAVLFELLTVLTLSSCASHRPPHTAELVPFTSDGCSLFPDGTFKDRDKWCDCCQNHDLFNNGSLLMRSDIRRDIALKKTRNSNRKLTAKQL